LTNRGIEFKQYETGWKTKGKKKKEIGCALVAHTYNPSY
jgi:hypothetical protein